MKLLLAAGLCLVPLMGQEAVTGFDLRATLMAGGLAGGEGTGAMGRAVFYPTFKLSEHWTVSGGLELISEPYAGDFRFRVLNANVSYSQVWKKASLVLRAGQMPSTMGSFLLRYDDAVNPMTDAPLEYGYYGGGVTTLGLAGAEADVTAGKWDARAQFVTSSPARARSIFENGQFGNWVGGIGYTVRQGLHVGAAGYRGDYRAGGLPASGWGIDAEWDRGHWNTEGEWHRFDLAYFLVPTLRQEAAYVETKRVLHPRWYVGARAGYLHSNYKFGGDSYEVVAGFRPNVWQIIKVAYGVERELPAGELKGTVTAQLVTTLHPLSLALR